MEPLVEMRGVSFRYDADPVLQDVNLVVEPGDFACIIGPNGGGKSTLLRLMLGLIEPSAGGVRLFGGRPRGARQRIGYMPQHVYVDRQFPVSALDVVLMGRLRGMGPYRQQDRDAARKALEQVGLTPHARKRFAALSGGQRQRALIARALASEPEVLMLDEPTASLDMAAEDEIYALLRDLNTRHTIIVVSHDVGFVSQYVRKAICVNRTVHVHTAEQLSHEVMQTLYGRAVRTLTHGGANAAAHACGGDCAAGAAAGKVDDA